MRAFDLMFDNQLFHSKNIQPFWIFELAFSFLQHCIFMHLNIDQITNKFHFLHFYSSFFPLRDRKQYNFEAIVRKKLEKKGQIIIWVSSIIAPLGPNGIIMFSMIFLFYLNLNVAAQTIFSSNQTREIWWKVNNNNK